MKLAKRVKEMRESEIRKFMEVSIRPGMISFAGGLPSPHSFPIKEIERLSIKVLKNEGTMALQYGATEGVREFRRTIAKRMNKKLKIKCKEENVLITTGSQQVLDLVTKIFVDPRDLVVVEVPTYIGALCSFRNYQSKFLTVGMDSEGMKVDELESKLREMNKKKRERIKFIYSIPNFHNPKGITLSMERRKHLLEISKKYQIPILEDDPYIELRYRGKTLPTMKSMDKEGLVIYTSTFSKILSPGLRLGWVVADGELIKKLSMAKQGTDLSTNVFSQYIANEYIKTGLVDKHIPKIRKMYKKREEVMLESLEEYFPDGCEWTKPDGGMFLWVTLPKKINTKKMFNEAIKRKVAYIHGAAFCVDGSGYNEMRLNFSNQDENNIREGIKRLGNLIKKKL
ncbi:MAG: PLP-dependent aminotransferase family protein [Candidatus Aenigmarchaeota archaeon]|nr:PLP-dependent aminotransferase family protein [Candidatus Aenigmarchaeota archaeon]